MSKNQSIKTITTTTFVTLEEAGRNVIQRMLTHTMSVVGVSKMVKADLIVKAASLNIVGINKLEVVNVYGSVDVSYVPVFGELSESSDIEKVTLSADALALLSDINPAASLEVMNLMVEGVLMKDICKAPVGLVSPSSVPAVMEFASKYDVSKLVTPTRKMALVFVTELEHAKVDYVNMVKNVVVSPRLELRSQNHIHDVLAHKTVMITRHEETGEIMAVSKEKAAELVEQGKVVSEVVDMRYLVSIDYNLEPKEGTKELDRNQRFIQTRAITEGVYFEAGGQMVKAEFFMQSASEKRTVMGTHIAGKDAVEVLHELGMDFRQFAKVKGGKYKLDMTKAPTRFGLSSTSSIPSKLIRIGNTIEEYANGDYAIVGGSHTMLCTNDIYAYVREGKYLAFDTEADEFIEIDAAEVPFKRNVTDGLIFADASFQFTLAAEFGLLMPGEQVRITPATKGLVVFVPGLKDKVGHDLLAFESATKGNYKTLLRVNPEYKIEVRIAKASHNASLDKKITTIPYQMIQTIRMNMDDVKAKLDAELEKAFEVYDSPERLAEYFGMQAVSALHNVSEDDLSDDDKELLNNTLISMFTNFFYAGDFVMEDPYFKKRLLDIIENIIKAWTRGCLPVEGHYRFMVSDVYAVLEAYTMANYAMEKGFKTEFIEYDKEGNVGSIVVPSHVGIPANHVVMVDDNDKYFSCGEKYCFNRNPKISRKETAFATTIVQKEYYMARKEYKFAFNNLIFFSCHDFNAVKQGGANL